MAPSGQHTRSSTLSAIKDFTLLCVIKREVLLVALQSKALQLSGLGRYIRTCEQTYMHSSGWRRKISDLFMLDKNFHGVEKKRNSLHMSAAKTKVESFFADIKFFHKIILQHVEININGMTKISAFWGEHSSDFEACCLNILVLLCEKCFCGMLLAFLHSFIWFREMPRLPPQRWQRQDSNCLRELLGKTFN